MSRATLTKHALIGNAALPPADAADVANKALFITHYVPSVDTRS
jgi:hypothetical protein